MEIFKLLALLLIIFILPLIYIKIISPLRIRLKVKQFRKRKILEITDEISFRIHTPCKGMQVFYWKEVSRIDLENSKIFKVYFFDNSILELNRREFSEMYSFVRAIPEVIVLNEKLKSYIAETFSNLTCCKICGKVALKGNECLNCYTETFESLQKKFKDITESETEYIRSNQLNIFCPFDESSEVDFYGPSILYADCPHWHPMVTSKEVIEFNKEVLNS